MNLQDTLKADFKKNREKLQQEKSSDRVQDK
jgi:hypothetical protein